MCRIRRARCSPLCGRLERYHRSLHPDVGAGPAQPLEPLPHPRRAAAVPSPSGRRGARQRPGRLPQHQQRLAGFPRSPARAARVPAARARARCRGGAAPFDAAVGRGPGGDAAGDAAREACCGGRRGGVGRRRGVGHGAGTRAHVCRPAGAARPTCGGGSGAGARDRVAREGAGAAVGDGGADDPDRAGGPLLARLEPRRRRCRHLLPWLAAAAGGRQAGRSRGRPRRGGLGAGPEPHGCASGRPAAVQRPAVPGSPVLPASPSRRALAGHAEGRARGPAAVPSEGRGATALGRGAASGRRVRDVELLMDCAGAARAVPRTSGERRALHSNVLFEVHFW
ncbi:hypothetical protein DFJ74DRAFT_648084 [Hyaloraphidium curvatum]|nr:hypothetical protein DFJ74DRAFT_648084 [Hyaloraphidium curvatum]